MNWKLYGLVMAGELRVNIVKLLNEPKTPTQLRNMIKTQDSAIARCLRTLEKHKIVKQLNPNIRKGKIYILTNVGKDILKQLLSQP